MRKAVALAAALVAVGSSALEAQLPLPEGKVFAQNPNLPPGGEFVVLAGTPSAAGPYAFRVRFAPGLKVMPHTHPDDRLYTVLSGTWTIGLGTEFDASKLQRYAPGAVFVLPANTPHFHGAPEGTTTFQVSGIGPTATVYLRPEDDPRRH